MHRLASRALYDYKGLTGISFTGKPIHFIKEACTSRPANLTSVLCSKLATAAHIPSTADHGHLLSKFNAVLSFPCIVPGPESGLVITYPGERIPN